MLSFVLTLEDSLIPLGDRPLISAAVILERIKQRAIDRWGDEKWQMHLVREYARLAQAQGDDKATPNARRGQIVRAFEVGSCTLDTAILLAAAVGCRFQMACTTIEVEEF